MKRPIGLLVTRVVEPNPTSMQAKPVNLELEILMKIRISPQAPSSAWVLGTTKDT
jgi:hypothetical protein